MNLWQRRLQKRVRVGCSEVLLLVAGEERRKGWEYASLPWSFVRYRILLYNKSRRLIDPTHMLDFGLPCLLTSTTFQAVDQPAICRRSFLTRKPDIVGQHRIQARYRCCTGYIRLGHQEAVFRG